MDIVVRTKSLHSTLHEVELTELISTFCAVCRSRATTCWVRRNGEMMVLAWIAQFHLKVTQINSEMNWIAKHKCTESQKLDNLKEAWDAEVRTWMAHHIFISRSIEQQQYIFPLFVYVLFCVIRILKASEKSDFYSETKTRVRPTGDVAPQPPIFSSVSINKYFNKAFVWFYSESQRYSKRKATR